MLSTLICGLRSLEVGQEELLWMEGSFPLGTLCDFIWSSSNSVTDCYSHLTEEQRREGIKNLASDGARIQTQACLTPSLRRHVGGGRV